MHATRGIRPKPKIEAPYPSAYRRSEAIDPLNEGLYSNLPLLDRIHSPPSGVGAVSRIQLHVSTLTPRSPPSQELTTHNKSPTISLSPVALIRSVTVLYVLDSCPAVIVTSLSRRQAQQKPRSHPFRLSPHCRHSHPRFCDCNA